MAKTLVLVHTVAPLVDAFAGWCRELLPGVRVFHILDEPLLERIRLRGTATAEDEARLATHLELAAEVGADVALVTCSTVSRSVEAVRGRSPVPVVTIDDAMAAEAVRLGPRIAVIATNPTTVVPTQTLLRKAAERAGVAAEISMRLVDGALQAVLTGDGATHDRLVMRAVQEQAPAADVVVLAQASSARVLAALAASDVAIPVPVLTSPHLALAEVGRLLTDGISPQHESHHHEVRP